MTLKLDNSIPKDPYTKQLWPSVDQQGLNIVFLYPKYFLLCRNFVCGTNAIRGNNSEWSGRKARNFCYPGGGATSISDGIFWRKNSKALRCLLKKVGSRAFLIFVRQNFRAPGNNNYNSAKVKKFENTNFHAICCSITQSTNTKETWGTTISLRFKIRFRICSIERFPFPSFSDFTIIQEITRTSKQDRQTAANCRYWAASKLKMLLIKNIVPQDLYLSRTL